MDKDELKRLRIIATVFAVCTLVLLIAITIFGTIELTRIKQSIQEIKASNSAYEPVDYKKLASNVSSLIERPSDGLNGLNGKNGRDGKDGLDGQDSVSTHEVTLKETTIIKEQPIVGPQGPPGNDGKDGRVLEIATTPQKLVLYRYTGDRFWNEAPVVDLSGDN